MNKLIFSFLIILLFLSKTQNIFAYQETFTVDNIIIEGNIKGFFFFSPIIPLLLVSTHALKVNDNYSSLILVVSLFLSFSIDLILIKKKSDKWFKKLRINATILASISFLI